MRKLEAGLGDQRRLRRAPSRVRSGAGLAVLGDRRHQAAPMLNCGRSRLPDIEKGRAILREVFDQAEAKRLSQATFIARYM
ncbi:hypothetical protein CSW62_22280 [Caulobacter sp. FWC2]|nr:hypothetical protein CSW62_22280 [Caulobacter sp. FWC2]